MAFKFVTELNDQVNKPTQVANLPSFKFATELNPGYQPPSTPSFSWANFKKSEDTTPLKAPTPIQTNQPTIWDQIKAFDIKGLSGGNLPGHQGFFDPLNDGGGKFLPGNLDNTGVGQFLKRANWNNNPANDNVPKPNLGTVPNVLADLFGGVQQFAMGGQGGVGALGQDVFNAGANASKALPEVAGLIKSGAGSAAIKDALKLTASEIGSKLPFESPTLTGQMLGMGAGGAGLTAAETLDNNQKLTPQSLATSALQNAAIGGLLHLGGKGIELGSNKINGILADRQLGQPTGNSLDQALQQFKAPSYRDAKTQQLANTFADTTNNLGKTGQTLQFQGMTPEELLKQKQLDAQGVFGRPLPQYKINTDLQNSIDEIQAQLDNRVNDITKSLKQMDNQSKVETIRKQIKDLGGISQGNPNIFEEQKIIPNWIKNNNGRPLDEVADTLGMNSDELLKAISDSAYKPKDYETEAYRIAYNDPEYQSLSNTLDNLKILMPDKKAISGKPNLQPRISSIPNLPSEVEGIRPTPQKLTWTNREGIPLNGGLKPPEIKPTIPNINPKIETPSSTSGPMEDISFWNKVKDTLGWKGNIDSLQNGIKTGKVDTSELPMASEIRHRMNLQAFAQPNEFVHTNPIDINIGKNDKVTSADIRQAYVGKMNKQIVTGNQLRDTIQKLAPKEQEGIQLYLDAGGDMNHLKDMANNSDPKLDKLIPNTKTTYREAYNQALNLSPEAQKAASMAQKYYEESGQYALDTGSTRSIIDNYANRMWKQEPTGTIKSEVRKPGLNPYTSHSKQRYYETIGEGILSGKTPATLNAGDLLSLHNQEMARANTNRELAASLEKSGLGAYQFDKPSQGFTSIDSLSRDIPTTHEGKPAIIHQNFVIPDGIAKGLQAITDPNYLAKIDALKHLQAYQGLVKTVDLSFSLFHHITLAAQALYNSRGGVDFIKNWDNMSKLGSETFNAAEKWGAEHGLMTTKIDDNYDVVRKLLGDNLEGKFKDFSGLQKANWVTNKIKNVPGIKQVGQIADKNTEFLFGKIQRWLKVTDFQNKAAAFVGKNPNMTNAEVTKGLRQIASEVNNAYGGLNWKAMGVTPSIQAISRLGLLAPDWTFSSARMLGQAFTKGPGGSAARSQFAVGIIGGAILTEGLNKLLTGHYTNQNSKGHELEVEVQPGVYLSFFRSGIGDVTKWAANIIKQGPLGGTVNTIQGKMSPLAKTLVGQLSNKQPTGAPITNANNTGVQNDLARLKSAAETFLPIPMGIPSTQRYLNSGQVTPLGFGLVGTGAGTYKKTAPINPLANPKDAYSGNWLDSLVNPPDQSSNSLIDKISSQEKAQTENNKLINQALGKALATRGSTSAVFNQYNVPYNKRNQMLSAAKQTYAENRLSPLAKKFEGLSKAGQTQFLKSLNPSEKSKLLSEPGLKRK